MNNMIPFPMPTRAAQKPQTANPMQAVVNRFMGGMSPTAIAEQIGGPAAAQAKKIISGKSEDQLKSIAVNMAKQRGVDLDALARQMGISIPK